MNLSVTQGNPRPTTRMSIATRNETILLLIAVGVITWLAPRLPAAVEPGELVAGGALTLLVQGGIRDVISVIRRKHRQNGGRAPVVPPEKAHCMCIESTVGLSGVLVGVLLTVVLTDAPRLTIQRWLWPVMLATVGAGGLAIRDLVIQWKPVLRIKRVADHGSILIRFR